MPGPLDGVRVIDLTHVLNGPFCTMLLAHLGAEVIKVEHGDGDVFRRLWTAPDADHDAYEFAAVNANKKSITLNLKHRQGRQMLLELVRVADVVVENFSLGAMDRLGLSYEVLRDANERIIYAASRGYGDSGPYAADAAFANTIMAISGWVEGAWDWAGTPGRRVLGIADEAAGISLALGICAALLQRERSGVGQSIEVSMQEAQLGFLISRLHEHFEDQPIGAPYRPCRDGFMTFYLGGLSDAAWRSLSEALGHAEAAADPRFATAEERARNAAALDGAVDEWMLTFTRQELWAILRSAHVASAPVLSIGEALEDPHLVAREAVAELEHPTAGTLLLVKPWIRFNGTPGELAHPGPAVGEHNADVYGRLLGLDDDALARLRTAGAI